MTVAKYRPVRVFYRSASKVHTKLTKVIDNQKCSGHDGLTSKLLQPPMEDNVATFLRSVWFDEQGQDIAEYAVMVAVILIIVVGTIRLIGSNSNTVFSNVASSIQ